MKHYFLLFFGLSIALLVGFSLGRIGHIYGGNLPVPHHWIYGPILALVAFFYRKKPFSIYILFLGIGVFVSDWNDFTLHRFLGGEEPPIKKFWGID